MKINLNLAAQFGIKYKQQSLKDRAKMIVSGCKVPKVSIDDIKNITPKIMAGTRCKDSIPLMNFWKFIEKNKYLKNNGFSTNTKGYGNSFLKAKAEKAISTSFVHDCSVMYLFNAKTKTHSLYHAMPDCSYEKLKFFLKTLMPEGVTKGAIIPGDSFFYSAQAHNMKNMLKLLKSSNPDAVINVYHTLTKYPEIAGLNGNVYEIPNVRVIKQIKANSQNIEDYGQATFRILDLQGCNTFECINEGCKSVDDLKILERYYSYNKCPKEMLSILQDAIKKKRDALAKKIFT